MASGIGHLAARFSRSIRVQVAALVVIFVVPPILLYSVFRSAEFDKQTLLLNAVRENGRLVARALEPTLMDLQPGDFSRIPQELARFEADQRSIKLLFRPNGSDAAFFYVASAPPVPSNALDQERKRLIDMGILERLAGSCSGNVALGERLTLPERGGEVLTSVTPVQSPKGCWAVVVASNEDFVVKLIDGRPYWTRPETQWAAAVYTTMALLVFLIFMVVWAALRRFSKTAALIDDGQSFATSTTVPELARLGLEFDVMVGRLRRATDVMRQAAEDNAHAFKGPIAVVRQAVELVRAKAGEEGDAAVGVAAIVSSLNRLEGLVRAAQRLDTATADLLDSGWGAVDLSALVEAFSAGYRLMLGPRQGILVTQIAPAVFVNGRDDIIETVIENLVDNAVSFSPDGGHVFLRLAMTASMAELTVEDDGPGVDETDLGRIFERYYSSRPSADGEPTNHEMHFGIGLWMVKQHTLALGGTVVAENRANGGLAIHIRLPRTTAT